eukprot:TRINITY_DN12815_c0_g1_i1.p1 TRINITY_DN12815_c0_g1~~TRINITY_DN12815_c0_g1_i1.p1  ORF type:complete len:705 (+),score=184.81 TRINITY_DN12815_c0_g1_i1:34-2148(+)
MDQLAPPADECVKVIVRCRPMSEQEETDGRKKIVSMDFALGSVSLKAKEAGGPPKVFTFDSVYDERSRQIDVYRDYGHPIVESIMRGYNGTIFAYGQTGSGKTFTMEGKGAPEDRGIIPNAFFDIFTAISHETHKQFLVRVSFLEIYQEDIYDLLAKRKKCELKEDPEKGVYVKDITYIGIKNEREIEKVMEVGKKNRRAAATSMNANSSRSHSIFTITVESSEVGPDGENHIRVGKLNLVDLAGSERQAKTHAEGDRLKEAIKINLSLSALGNVIKALVKKGSTHIPYRDSKLTRLLQDSLGGNTKTVMVAAIGPADWNFDETISTLRYATRAKSIRNKPKINEDPKDALLRQFQDEIERLKKLLEAGQGANPAQVQQLAAQASAAAAAAGVVGQTQASEEELTKLQTQLEEERRERALVSEKLAGLEHQVLAGGTIMEKAREQEVLLQQAQAAQEKARREQLKLRHELLSREAQLGEHMEKFNSVQEELSHKTKQLKKAYAKLQDKQEEIEDMQGEFDTEREDMLDTIRELAKQLKYQKAILDAMVPVADLQAVEQCLEWDQELDDWVLIKPIVSPVQREMKLKDLIIDAFIPPSELQKIVRRAEYDPDLGDFRVRGLELSGNRLRQNPRFRPAENLIDVAVDMPDRRTQDYDDLGDMNVQQMLQDAYRSHQGRPSSAMRGARPKTATRRESTARRSASRLG